MELQDELRSFFTAVNAIQWHEMKQAGAILVVGSEGPLRGLGEHPLAKE